MKPRNNEILKAETATGIARREWIVANSGNSFRYIMYHNQQLGQPLNQSATVEAVQQQIASHDTDRVRQVAMGALDGAAWQDETQARNVEQFSQNAYEIAKANEDSLVNIEEDSREFPLS